MDVEQPKRLKVNKEQCTMCGVCVAMYQDLFEIGEDQKAKVKVDADFTGKDIESIKSACVYQAIEEEGTSE